MRVEAIAIPGLPEVGPGDDLAALVVAAAAAADIELRDGDVLCVAQKVVSKAEGATVPRTRPDPRADRWEAARREARRVVAETPWVLITETRHGFVCANAGIDASNTVGDTLTLLPRDPDASAARLRAALRERTGRVVGVIVTDTFGRAWRMGQTEVAIGCAGMAPLRDERGGVDRRGHTLEVTVTAVADEVAAAADLVRTKASGTPVVIVRGLDVAGEGGAAALIRPLDEDLFRWGGPQAAEAALAAAVDGARDDPDAVGAPPAATVARLAATVTAVTGVTCTPTADDGASGTSTLRLASADDGARGAAVLAVRVLAAAHGLRVEVDGADIALRVGRPRAVEVLPADR